MSRECASANKNGQPMHQVTPFDEHTIRLLACGCVNLLTLANKWNYSQITAPYWRLYWNDKPGAVLIEGVKHHYLKPQVLALIPPHAVFSTRNCRPADHFYIHFQLLQPTLTMQSRIMLTPLRPAGQALLREIIASLHNASGHSRKLSFLARSLIEWAFSTMTDVTAPARQCDARLMAILTFLDQHVGALLDNSNLARQVGMSKNAFMRLFKAQYGVTPHAVIQCKRIEKACIMLHFSNASIDQIAEATGFCDRFHFSRTFKRIQGIAPAAFRRQTDHVK